MIWSQGAETESSECFLIFSPVQSPVCQYILYETVQLQLPQGLSEAGCFMAVWISMCFNQSSSEKRCNDIQITPLSSLFSVCVILRVEQNSMYRRVSVIRSYTCSLRCESAHSGNHCCIVDLFVGVKLCALKAIRGHVRGHDGRERKSYSFNRLI